MRWGLVGFGSKGPDPKRATFNARCENLTKSGLWRVPLHKRRCLVPISGFYEWRKPDKTPFRFTLSDQPLYALAGLWDAWKETPEAVEARVTIERKRVLVQASLKTTAGVDEEKVALALAAISMEPQWLQSFSIITVEANPMMKAYHDRMPAILNPRDYDEWLDRSEVERPPMHLLRPFPETTMLVHTAHPNVGNVRNNGPEMLNSA